MLKTKCAKVVYWHFIALIFIPLANGIFYLLGVANGRANRPGEPQHPRLTGTVRPTKRRFINRNSSKGQNGAQTLSHLDEVFFSAEVFDDELLAFGSVFAHEKAQKLIAVVDVLERDFFEADVLANEILELAG
ncbi:hypothetical protein M2103_002010 [Ereboglobus sp. PH5-5]|nr:hypothetical protein [Ereboglobus sp. PH5-5]